MTRQITVEHNGTTYFGEVMRAESTHIGVEDHGILTAYVHCKSDSGGIGIGGMAGRTSTSVPGSSPTPTPPVRPRSAT